VSKLQSIHVGTLFPALPGASDGFHVLRLEPRRSLVLGFQSRDHVLVTWAFVLRGLEPGRTRLIVRARGSKLHNPLGLPRWLGVPLIRAIHFVMQRKQLLGIKRRAESDSRLVRLAAKAAA
jgi:hypothetical protein